MTKFRAVLVLPLDEQDNVDGNYIDPAGVQFDPDTSYPIFRDFSYGIDDTVGHGRVSRADDGSLVVSGDISGFAQPEKIALAIGVSTVRFTRTETGMDVAESKMFAISTTASHADRNQPPIESLDS